LLPIVLQLATAFSDKVIPLVEKFTKAFSNSEGNLGGVVISVGNILQNTFTPIINGLIKAFGYVRNAIGDNLDTFKEFGGYIAKYLAPVIGTVLGGALQVAGKIAGGVIDVIAGVVKILNGLISGAVAGINALISAYNAIPFLPNVSKISTPKVSVPTIKTPTVSTSVPKIPTISAPSATGSAGGGGGGGGIASATKVAATAAAATSSSAFPFGTSGVNTNTLAGIMAASGTTINLTVQGALDKEGTARTIVETLNNSYYRGTGGATGLVAI
jgi:hypothetical protein